MDNTTFGGTVPPLPQWSGPPHSIVHVLAMLYASLATSLFSAFLAMLGKQWLNRYASTDMRGTGIERSQDRQRKLGGIITWYFDYVMESLPLMLQVALLLLGCALSLYLWEIDVTVACVVLGVTALGVIFYTFIVVAGTASASCPYQTPGARILRHICYHILPRILGLLLSAYRGLLLNSRRFKISMDTLCCLCVGAIFCLPLCILYIPYFLVYDACRLTRKIAGALIVPARRVSIWIRSARSARARRLNQRAAALDSKCISWILQTSLEKDIRLSTLKYLATAPTLVDFTPALVSDCFDILIDCFKVNEEGIVVVQGTEELMKESSMCLFLAYSHLSIMDPTPDALVDVRQRYRRFFPRNLSFRGLLFLRIIHEAIYPDRQVDQTIEWRGHNSTNHEHVAVTRALSKLSWSEYRRREPGRVPPLCLSFARHYLSQDPLPPPSVIANCLLIIAISLGCNIPNTMTLEERCVCV